MFHMLRRQMLRPLRKPLIIMTPKSLLRHPLSVSRLDELSGSGFQTIIDEIDELRSSAVTRIVFCSGKVYFDLLKSRRDSKVENVAIVRVEQLYPFPSEEYESILQKYSNAREIVWCQEEPQNQGSWYQIRHRLQSKLDATARAVCMRGAPEPRRPRRASQHCTSSSRKIWSPRRCRACRRKKPPDKPSAYRPLKPGQVLTSAHPSGN